MSAIAGFTRFDNAPIDPATVSRMASRLALRGDSLTTSRHDDSAFIFAARGGDHLPQPLTDSHSGRTVVIDGRIDNRPDLIRALELSADTTDAAIVLAAYGKWGMDFGAKLLGDFAIAIADRRERRVVCARDVFGTRRLHYRSGRGWFAFASSIDCLVAAIDPMPEINEGMAGEVLASFVVSVNETLYRDVYRLPAAHLLLAGGEQVVTRRYWEPAVVRLPYTRDAQYEEHLRAVLGDAVASCLRTAAPAAVMLSGGLDSSSVTGLAARLVQRGEVGCPSIETFSIVGAGDNDESAYSGEVASANGLLAHQISEQRPSSQQLAEEIAIDLEPQLFPQSVTMNALHARVRDRGMRVLLTGVGGDDWLGTAPAAYADLLRRGRIGAALRRFVLDRGEDHDPGWHVVARLAIWPLVPAALQQRLRRMFGRGQPPPWLDAGFAKRIALEERMSSHRPARLFETHEQDANWFEAMNGWRMFVTENLTRGADRFGIDLAHPFFERRLVEFCLALPGDQLWRDGRPKDLLRRALRDIVPAAVSARRWSPSADHVFLGILEREAGCSPFADLEMERAGWLNGPVIRAMHGALNSAPPLQRASHGRILWGIRALELCLQARNPVKMIQPQQGSS